MAREPGARSKIAVASSDEQVDPVGACVGHRGSRVQAIVNELYDEKIDIVRWSEDVDKFIAEALSPAKVISVETDEETRSAFVIVPDNQLSLAIGKSGQNVRLAARLTGWRIDIRSESQVARAALTAELPEGDEEAELAAAEAETSASVAVDAEEETSDEAPAVETEQAAPADTEGSEQSSYQPGEDNGPQPEMQEAPAVKKEAAEDEKA